MTRVGFLVAAVAALSVSCGLGMGQKASMFVAEKNGRLFVDESPVDFHREVAIEGEMDIDTLMALSTHTGLIDVVGVPGDRYELIIDVYSEFEMDGAVVIEDGRLVIEGNQGRCVLNGIRGRLPKSVDLNVSSATGDVVITSFDNNAISADTGTGAMMMLGCTTGTLSIDSATSGVRLEASSADSVQVHSGTGAIAGEGCEFLAFIGETSSGDFRFQDSRLEKARFISTTGNVIFTNTTSSMLNASLGTGEIIRHSGSWNDSAQGQDDASDS